MLTLEGGRECDHIEPVLWVRYGLGMSICLCFILHQETLPWLTWSFSSILDSSCCIKKSNFYQEKTQNKTKIRRGPNPSSLDKFHRHFRKCCKCTVSKFTWYSECKMNLKTYPPICMQILNLRFATLEPVLVYALCAWIHVYIDTSLYINKKISFRNCLWKEGCYHSVLNLTFEI